MPLFDAQCYTCGYVDEVLLRGDEVPVCDGCGMVMRIYLTFQHYHPFREGWYEHIDPDGPIYITNKKQLRDECRKRGLTSHYVEGSSIGEI